MRAAQAFGGAARMLALLALVGVALAGCRTGGGDLPRTADPAAAALGQGVPAQPKEALLAALEEAPAEGLARIVFYRRAVPFLQGLSPDVIVNGLRVGTLEMGSGFVRLAKPGGYEIFSTHDPETVVSLSLAPGETRYVKLGPALQGLGFRLSAEEVPERLARPELRDLDLSRKHLGA